MSVCQIIVKSTEDEHPKYCRNKKPLHYAAEYGHFSICQLIVEKSRQQINNLSDFEDNSPLHMAAKNGHLSICELLISWVENTYPNAFPADFCNIFGTTPVHLAAEKGHLSACQFLLGKVGKFENIKKGNDDGITPLSFAARNGHSAVCHLKSLKVLLTKGTSIMMIIGNRLHFILLLKRS